MKTTPLTPSMLIHPDELSVNWIERAKKIGLPILGLHPVGGLTAHESMQELLDRTDDPAFCELLSMAERNGIRIEYEMHAMGYFLPREMFATHPEWFRENEHGERVADLNCCASNEEALDHIAVRAADAARRLTKPLKHPTYRYFFWMDDALNGRCHCEKCRSLSSSDQQMRVMNRILREIREDYPEAKLAYLAYAECFDPPKQEKPDDGIFLEFAPMDRDFHIPIDGDSEKNRNMVSKIPALFETFGDREMKVLEYWIDNSMYSGWKKPEKRLDEDKAVVRADFAFYRSMGFDDISTFACYLGPHYEELHGEPDISATAEEMRKMCNDTHADA